MISIVNEELVRRKLIQYLNELETVRDYYQSFLKLGQLEIIDQQLAKKLAPSTGLHNRLVHEYEEIDDEIVFNSIQTSLKLYKKYIAEIKTWLDNN